MWTSAFTAWTAMPILCVCTVIYHFLKNLYLKSIAEQTIALNISMALPKSKEQNQRALNSEHENDFKK